MSHVLDHMDGDVLARQAAEAWFARLMAADCSAEECEAFARWHAMPAHAQAYAATEQLWARLDGLENDEVIGPYAEAALEPESVPAPAAEWASSRQRRQRLPARGRPRWRLPAALAAGVTVCALGLRLLLPLMSSVDPEHYRTTDQLQTVTLADGSRVRMDLSTQIEVRLSRRERDVALLHGRAIFDVAHDATRPFVVDTGHGFVTALGTRFQVDREAGDVVVTLVEGSVSVGEKDDGPASIRLAPGEQARYTPQQTQWSRSIVDTAVATSWSRGFHVFSATPLAEAVREINRYSPTKLRLQGAGLETLVLSGNFKTGDADRIAEALPIVLPVKTKKVAGEIVVTRR